MIAKKKKTKVAARRKGSDKTLVSSTQFGRSPIAINITKCTHEEGLVTFDWHVDMLIERSYDTVDTWFEIPHALWWGQEGRALTKEAAVAQAQKAAGQQLNDYKKMVAAQAKKARARLQKSLTDFDKFVASCKKW